MGIVAVGTVFPLVFAIGAAYTERNKATKTLGEIKVSACTHTDQRERHVGCKWLCLQC
jgi:hypothetical protein